MMTMPMKIMPNVTARTIQNPGCSAKAILVIPGRSCTRTNVMQMVKPMLSALSGPQISIASSLVGFATMPMMAMTVAKMLAHWMRSGAAGLTKQVYQNGNKPSSLTTAGDGTMMACGQR
jgi:hypothetical protein